MIELVSEKVWESLRTVTWPGPVRAAIAYVGREAPELLPLGAGDTLVFDGSDESLAGGTTNPAALQVLFDRGVVLVSVARLHAKVIVAGADGSGERKTLVGSANASERSRTSLREAALLTDDVEVAARADLQIDEWSGDPEAEWVDQEWIERATTIYRPRSVPLPPRRAGLPRESHRRLWIAPWTPDDSPASPAEEAAIEHFASRFTDLSVESYRLSEGDIFVRPGDELLLFAVKDGQGEPHGNRRSWPVSRVVRVVNEVGDPTHAAICVGPFEGPSMTYSEVRRLVHAEGEEFHASGPLTTRAAATVRRALAETEGRAAEVEVDALRERPIGCPRCETRLRVVLRGLPAGPPDPDVYVLGGCVIGPGPMPTHVCPACGWEGRRRDWDPEQVRQVESLDDLFAVLGATDLASATDAIVDELDHDPVGLDLHKDADGNEMGVEAILGTTGVLLELPFSMVEFWDTWDGLRDAWQLQEDDEVEEA
ncbi:phospholipase D-like domain-containing protein [Oerskovia merdavium]|uniref:PLD phosphodiesterase domain-containing protein n=1 Tax=Oerskovia merdavium TaxID=2762227 RepID=A0ABR8TZ97_9CELL|nr:hypothetical protein [Oerskovia merdavium]MBD7981102.1 hypothetical protein [Oerskovia merdavium]